MRKHPPLAALLLGLATACGGGGGGGGGGDGPDLSGPPLRAWVLYSTDLGCDGVIEPCASRVEVLDLETRTIAVSYPLNGVDAWALAVKQDGSKFFVVDRRTQTVRGYDSGGNPLGAVPLPFALSLVLSPDEAFLYAVGGTLVIQIDVATMQEVDTLDLAPWQPNSIAISADGTRLAMAMGHDVTNAAVGIVSTDGGDDDDNLESEGAATLTGSVDLCDATPEAVAFTNHGTVLAWDGVCDEIFEVDLDPLEEIPESARTSPDLGGVYGFARHCLGFSDATSTGFVATEVPNLFIAPPQPSSSEFVHGNAIGGRPFFPRGAAVGAGAYLVVALHVEDDPQRGGAVALDAVTRDPVGEIAEFAVPAGAVLADLRVIPAPVPVPVPGP